jgi:hypothetical protein
VLAVNGLADNCLISTKTKERGYIFPIFVGTNENLSAEFRAFLDSHYEHHYTPEEVLGYIYAVLHAPTYRARYAEFLRIDFPRVSFPASADDFETLSTLGWALVQAHLLREVPRRELAIYHGKRRSQGRGGALSLEFLPFELTPRPCRLKIVPHLGRIISWRLATLSNGEHSSLSMMRRALKPAPHLLGPVVRMVLKVTRLPQ